MGSPRQHSLRLQQETAPRDETSQGTWDAWCRAKVHGTLTSKLNGASTELPSRIIQSMGKAMEKAEAIPQVSTPCV